MKKILVVLFAFLILLVQVKSQNPLPKVISGKIERIENFQSKYVTARNVDIWLPEGYSAAKKYPVLYMHDGQMLFDAEITWNKQSWDIDDVALKLFGSKEISEFIVVGIWNGGETRYTDYFPKKPLDLMPKVDRDTLNARFRQGGMPTEVFDPQSDNYLKFIVEELKPYVDDKFSVNESMENTFVAGSSMGGLISMYAICEYPEVFGGAACMSTHWIGTFSAENNPIPDAFINYLSQKLPKPGKHKIYFDTGDQTLDVHYPEIQKKVDGLMASKGYSEKDWITKYFPGDDHSEKSWKARVHIPLMFLLGNKTL